MTPYHFFTVPVSWRSDSQSHVTFDSHPHLPKKVVQGFTLVETMVAITVLAIALVGPFTAVENALQASYVARDELVASSLAQEGMEYIRSVRDNNYLSGNTWIDTLGSFTCAGVSPTKFCSIDPTQGDIHNVPNTAMAAFSSPATVPPLYITTGGIYNQQNLGTKTRFTRYVQMSCNGACASAHEMQVTVTVKWTSAQQTYYAVVVDTIQDWL